tara:strand:- start:61 stop:783 length:723 start_codon:yes stop_codon:yes gene_type:complete
MKKLIKKLKDKGKKDIANLSEKDLKKHREKERAKEMEEFKKKQAIEKKDIQIIKKESIKYKENEKELLSLQKTINKRFNVSKTETKAKKYGVASLYFNALKIFGIPENYYPIDNDAHEMFVPGEPDDMPSYWLMCYQMNTSENDGGHTIPKMPGNAKEHVIHGFLFPMTSTTIYLGKFKFKDQFGIIYHPTDELFGREWMSTYTENYFKTYEEAYKEFEKTLEKHLDKDEERFYQKKKVI